MPAPPKTAGLRILLSMIVDVFSFAHFFLLRESSSQLCNQIFMRFYVPIYLFHQWYKNPFDCLYIINNVCCSTILSSPLATYLPTLLLYFYQFYFARATLQYYNYGFSSENTINVSQHRMLFSLSLYLCYSSALLFWSWLICKCLWLSLCLLQCGLVNHLLYTLCVCLNASYKLQSINTY